jgi:hypothetical protein
VNSSRSRLQESVAFHLPVHARRLFEEGPRRQQQEVFDVVSVIVEQFKRKAS